MDQKSVLRHGSQTVALKLSAQSGIFAGVINLKQFRIFFLSLSLILSSCVHTHSHEVVAVDLSTKSKNVDTAIDRGSIKIESLVYTQDKLPLQDFFRNLKHGDYKEALHRFDILYHPSNTNNEALTELINADYVPVYARLTNHGSEPVSIVESSFKLSDGHREISALPTEQLPTEFKHFNSEAALANTYNVTVVVVSVATLLVGVFALLVASNTANFHDLFPPSKSESSDSLSSVNHKVFNQTQKITEIDYRHFLISDINLQPGETVEGLIFFKGDAKLGNDLSLVLKEP